MMKKCEKPGCTKAGTCRAPKDRTLTEYWHFCQEHAAEYNKNWDYYAGMTDEERAAEYEREIYGTPVDDADKKRAAEYAKMIQDFLTGRATFDTTPPPQKTIPSPIMAALRTFGLTQTASWREVAARYRALAKKHHPDTATNKTDAATEFAKITNAYETLKKHFGKK